ncbi:MAG: zf-HC2 domain-containing protein [Chloroflexi bacterium]|nr:zf-HC2 domain-containing protein [Chloroflexota bacterium]
MFSKSFEQMHGWVDARLSAYMDNQLALDERARVDAHLRECARCKKSLASLQWTIALAKQAPAPVTNKSFTLSPQENRIDRI